MRCDSVPVRSFSALRSAALATAVRKVRCASSEPKNSGHDTHAHLVRSIAVLALPVPRDVARFGKVHLPEARLPSPAHDRHARPDQRPSGSSRTVAEARCDRERCCPAHSASGDRWWPFSVAVAPGEPRVAYRDVVAVHRRWQTEAAEQFCRPKAEWLALPKRPLPEAAKPEALRSVYEHCQTPAADVALAARGWAPARFLPHELAACDRLGCPWDRY